MKHKRLKRYLLKKNKLGSKNRCLGRIFTKNAPIKGYPSGYIYVCWESFQSAIALRRFKIHFLITPGKPSHEMSFKITRSGWIIEVTNKIDYNSNQCYKIILGCCYFMCFLHFIRFIFYRNISENFTHILCVQFLWFVIL